MVAHGLLIEGERRKKDAHWEKGMNMHEEETETKAQRQIQLSRTD